MSCRPALGAPRRRTFPTLRVNAGGRKFCRQLAMGRRQLFYGETMSLAKRNEGANVNSDINVTPMVDVMLVLLIIFMVITPMLQKGISVDMAKVNNPTPMQDADKEDALLVSVMKNGDVFFGSDKVAADRLTRKVQDRLTNRASKEVYLKADARAHFGNVVQVVDAVRAAGVDDLGLLTEQRKSTPNAPPATPTGGQ